MTVTSENMKLVAQYKVDTFSFIYYLILTQCQPVCIDISQLIANVTEGESISFTILYFSMQKLVLVYILKQNL